MRKERDALGEIDVPKDALYGIHALRARNNFPDRTPFPIEWYRAIGIVKHACYLTYRKFKRALGEHYAIDALPIRVMDDDVLNALIKSAEEVAGGAHYEHFIVPAISGGAGTSFNMNVNEILANRALTLLGCTPGTYTRVDPIEHANVFQSTNDVIPTSLKVAVIFLLDKLENAIERLRIRTESLEKEYRDTLRLAYTQMQEAVPSSYGKLFSCYNDAFSRDWWRVSKCFERIKVVNIGGSAIGTGLGTPRYFFMEVPVTLKTLTGKAITRGENLSDATNNLDPFVEVHAILTAHAVNIEKVASDMRLLSSSVVHEAEVSIPQKQVGSSVMPGKVNPVIPEFAISTAHRVYANNGVIATLSGQGALDLNAYLPTIGHAMIESINTLIAADTSLEANLFTGLTVDKERAKARVLASPSITTALIPYIGYNKASELAYHMKEQRCDIFAANAHFSAVDNARLKEIVKPKNLLREGYSVKEVMGG